MTLRHSSLKFIFPFILLFLLIAELFALQSPLFQLNPNWFNLAVATDLSLLVPVALFLLIRQWYPLKLRALISFVAIGALIGGLSTGTKLWFVAVALEAIVLILVIFKLRSFIQTIIVLKKDGLSLSQAIRSSLTNIITSISDHHAFLLLKLDIYTWRYSIFSFWQKQPKNALVTFSYSPLGNPFTKLALALMIVLEAIPVHFLIHQWSPIGAWVHTVINIYSLMFLFADYRAMQLRPIALHENTLKLHYGFRVNTTVALNQIVSIEPLDEEEQIINDQNIVRLSNLKKPQLVMTLNAPTQITKLFGKTQAQVLHLSVENPQEFVLAVLQQRDKSNKYKD